MANTPTLLRARFQMKSSERARKIEKLRRLEWQLDREWTMTLVQEVQDFRVQLTSLEREMVGLFQAIKLDELSGQLDNAKGVVEESAEDIIERVMNAP